jgi:hypothetical protein
MQRTNYIHDNNLWGETEYKSKGESVTGKRCENGMKSW